MDDVIEYHRGDAGVVLLADVHLPIVLQGGEDHGGPQALEEEEKEEKKVEKAQEEENKCFRAATQKLWKQATKLA